MAIIQFITLRRIWKFKYYNQMTVLFILSNIAIPFIVLSYTSLVQVHKNGNFSCIKWLFLILYTFLSNILFYLMSDNKIYLLFDLVFKLVIIFMPTFISQKLQRTIESMHLETYIDQCRALLLKYFFTLHSFMTQSAINRMNAEEQNLFKSAVINSLQRKTVFPSFTSNQAKKLENRGVQCEMLTMSMINDERMQKQLYKLQLSQSKMDPSKTQLNHYSSASNLKTDGGNSKFQLTNQKVSVMKKKPTFTLQKSTTDIGIYDEEERKSYGKQQFDSKYNKNNIKMTRAKSPQLRSKKQQEEPSMILNKLDASEYSDMFEDQENEKDGRKLLCKVETIIQISGLNSPRLEIYNIELYSNSQIRIISLYGRQFQRHKLVSMKPLKHGYYELKVEGGKVDSRKVKFRGSFQSFLKYLQTEK